MYLHEIFLQNTGPILECHVKPPFDENGNPQPIVIVGPNGSGKTIFLSYIVDALFEFAKRAFRDIVVPDSSRGTPYFRDIHPRAIRSGEHFSLSLLRFKVNKYLNVNETDLYYCEKLGSVDPDSYSPDVKSVFAPVWNWTTSGNHKNVLIDERTVAIEIERHAHAFFPSSRREDPDWLNPKSLQARLVDYESRFFNDVLNKSLWIETCAAENISWVLDVYLDSLVDFDEQPSKSHLKYRPEFTLGQQLTLTQSRGNVEQILQTILQDETAELILNPRYFGPSRISIKIGDGPTIPTLPSLSAGQSQLFNLFATIIRYGEWRNLNKSMNLSQIAGLVIIDDIDANLHPTLQHDVLPQLIGMFPKVQFIVSSHSPLFLLGMEKRFGAEKVTILELPEAKRINSERYSEFGKAFEYYQSTQSFEDETKRRFAAGTKPLVLTEGPLDVRYIRRALDVLGKNELLNSLDIEFVGIEDDSGKTRFGGDTWLNNFRNIYEANTSLYHRPILLLYDCDTQKPDEQVGDGERLWIRSIKRNRENTKVRKGIENLFPEDLFTAEFYTSKVETGDYGESKSIQEFNKPKFCDWICENGSDINFAKFDRMVEILKQFSEAYTEPPVQQPLQ
ncbi:hypothetical protein C6503_03740 [Candidatus Poribacteria bacterium]|nr:MAG: hypothetical protein C6503_03740 [Candidatus Poribacteria bacterium]